MIEFSNVTKTYKAGNKAIRKLNIQIADGEFVFIVGRSGSGKSTLLKMLLKEVEPTSGCILVGGQNLQRMPRRQVPRYRRRLGMVFQDFKLSPRKIRESVPAMLKLVGLSAKYKFYPHQLSGGEQQRVAIARALINNPEVLLADEPTGNLDRKNADDIMWLLEEINARGTTVIVVTHSQEIVSSMKKRVITMDKGMVVSDKRGGEIYEIQHNLL